MKTQISAQRALSLATQLTEASKVSVAEADFLQKEAYLLAENVFDNHSWFSKWISSEKMTGHKQFTQKQKFDSLDGGSFWQSKIDRVLTFHGTTKYDSRHPHHNAVKLTDDLLDVAGRLHACGRLGDPVYLDSKEAIFIYQNIGDNDE
jgi:hypothetical protein